MSVQISDTNELWLPPNSCDIWFNWANYLMFFCVLKKFGLRCEVGVSSVGRGARLPSRRRGSEEKCSAARPAPRTPPGYSFHLLLTCHVILVELNWVRIIFHRYFCSSVISRNSVFTRMVVCIFHFKMSYLLQWMRTKQNKILIGLIYIFNQLTSKKWNYFSTR